VRPGGDDDSPPREADTKALRVVLALIFLALFVGVAFLYSGVYPIGADHPHTAPVRWVINVLRDRSVEAHAKHIEVPDLSDSTMVLEGAGRYAAMCSGCHLAPGYDSDELYRGLYPRPPRLAKAKHLDPKEAFWVIKHGLKLTGMPAWGPTHDDEELWSMVAFLKKMPELSPEQYREMVARAPRDEDRSRMPMPGGPPEAHENP